MDQDDAHGAPTTAGAVVALLLGVSSGVVLAVSAFVTLPTVVMLTAAAALVTGMVLVAVLAYWHARRSGRSWPRVLGSTLWAPVRFVLDHA